MAATIGVLGEAIDITAPENEVEVLIKDDGRLWVNVDGICRLRICQIKEGILSVNVDGGIRIKVRQNN